MWCTYRRVYTVYIIHSCTDATTNNFLIFKSFKTFQWLAMSEQYLSENHSTYFFLSSLSAGMASARGSNSWPDLMMAWALTETLEILKDGPLLFFFPPKKGIKILLSTLHNQVYHFQHYTIMYYANWDHSSVSLTFT